MPSKYIPVFNEFLEEMAMLTDKEFGRLIRWGLKYNITGEADVKELTGKEKYYAVLYKDTIDRFADSYERRCEANRENGRKGGRPKKADSENPENPENPSVFSKNPETQETQLNQTKLNQAKPNQAELNSISPSGPSDEGPPGEAGETERDLLFNRFWEAYPKKVDKKEAITEWEKLSPDEALVEKMLSAIKNQKTWSQWQQDDGRYIPKPATWLSHGRWDDEKPEVQEGDKQHVYRRTKEENARAAEERWGKLPF